jgi:hypothetical protein
LALGVVVAGLGAIWGVGDSGRYVQRALLTWLLIDYLSSGLTLRVEPEVAGPVDVIFDRPFAYHDDANRELMLAFLWLSPARWLAYALAGLALYPWLPTVDQLAEQLCAEAANGQTDYALQVRPDSPARQRRNDEGAAFHHALRRDHGAQMAFPLLLCAAGLTSAVAWLSDWADLWALTLTLFVEAIAYSVSLLVDSAVSVHPDLLRLWLSRHRPDIAREGRQMAQNQPQSARVLLHALLAGALVLWTHVVAR